MKLKIHSQTLKTGSRLAIIKGMGDPLKITKDIEIKIQQLQDNAKKNNINLTGVNEEARVYPNDIKKKLSHF